MTVHKVRSLYPYAGQRPEDLCKLEVPLVIILTLLTELLLFQLSAKI